jgi:4-carboxymuconolactone decarboxylase
VSRLPGIRQPDLDDTGRALWDTITATRGAAVVGPDGSLIGPFNAFVTAPEVGARIAELGGLLRFQTSIDRHLLEVAIITTGAHWKAEFEWWAHARMAREHGVAEDVIAAIRDGAADVPFGSRDDERIVHAVARELATTGRVSAAVYEEARGLLGDRGLVELVSLCGYYTLISFTLNAFEVPLPDGVSPVWSAST